MRTWARFGPHMATSGRYGPDSATFGPHLGHIWLPRCHVVDIRLHPADIGQIQPHLGHIWATFGYHMSCGGPNYDMITEELFIVMLIEVYSRLFHSGRGYIETIIFDLIARYGPHLAHIQIARFNIT